MTTEPSPVRRRRIGRAITVVVVILILLPLVAIGVFVARFDPNAYKPEIEAAVARASGRKLSLGGPLSLGLSLTPVISAADVTLANPPGFSQPEMAKLSRLDAKLALLPLLAGRIEIESLALVRPDIAVEINRQGESNLAFMPAGSARGAAPGQEPAGRAGGAAPAGGAPKPVKIEVRQFAITDGKLTWQDDRSGRHGVLLLRSLAATSGAGGTRLAITAEGSYAGLGFSLTGQSGALARLVTPGAGPAWPIALAVASGPAMVKLTGSFTDPAAARGYRLEVHANLPALAALAPLVPGVKLPPLQGIVLAADLADAGNGRPEASNVSLAVGASDLGSLRPGLRLASLSLIAPRLDQPCKLTLAGTLGAAPFDLTATLGPPAALLPAGIAPPPPAAPWPVAIRATAAGADFAVSGTMTQPAALAGANLALSAQIPELGKLSPFAGFALPALAPITVSGQLADAASGWRQWVRLSALTLAAPAVDLAGDASLSLAGARPAINAALSAQRLDLDLLRKAFARPPAGHGVAAPATPPAPAPAPGARLIPDTKLPFAALQATDAEVAFAVGHLMAGGRQYANVNGKLALKDGKLVLAPFAADSPAGHVQITASADGAQATPPVAMTIEAPALALAPLLASFGLPARASGTIAVRAEFKGAGNTAHAIAAGLDGRLGIAMAGGSVDRSVLGDLIGPVLQRARVPPEMLGTGTSEVRCLAVRIDASGGTGTLAAGLLEMTGLTLTGSGNFWLGPETLGLKMVPAVEYRGGRLALPVEVQGSFLAPKVAPEANEAARSVAGAAGRLINPRSELGRFLSALEGRGGSPQPDCGPALALARFGAPGPAAPPAASATAAPAHGQESKPTGPLNLLRGLFH